MTVTREKYTFGKALPGKVSMLLAFVLLGHLAFLHRLNSKPSLLWKSNATSFSRATGRGNRTFLLDKEEGPLDH
jgi:hypothetical protein